MPNKQGSTLEGANGKEEDHGVCSGYVHERCRTGGYPRNTNTT